MCGLIHSHSTPTLDDYLTYREEITVEDSLNFMECCFIKTVTEKVEFKDYTQRALLNGKDIFQN